MKISKIFVMQDNFFDVRIPFDGVYFGCGIIPIHVLSRKIGKNEVIIVLVIMEIVMVLRSHSLLVYHRVQRQDKNCPF